MGYLPYQLVQISSINSISESTSTRLGNFSQTSKKSSPPFHEKQWPPFYLAANLFNKKNKKNSLKIVPSSI